MARSLAKLCSVLRNIVYSRELYHMALPFLRIRYASGSVDGQLAAPGLNARICRGLCAWPVDRYPSEAVIERGALRPWRSRTLSL